jgi:nucleoside-diphosphate kinase
MATQQCLVLIKPDGLIKSITGDVISALSQTKLKIVGAKIVSVRKELAEAHYSELKSNLIGKFGEEKGLETFNNIIKYIQGNFHTNRVMALVYQGEDAICKIREVVGCTNPEDADPCSIRGKYGRINSKTNVFETVVHASDSEVSAKREVQLWFSPDELAEVIYSVERRAETIEKSFWKQ